MTGRRTSTFLELHVPGTPLLMPNPWDVGSATLLASLGFKALATTSSGFAYTLGRLDGGVSRDEAIAHGGELAAAVDVPVSADLENCFADSPEGVAETVGLAAAAGLAGCSVEDFTRNLDDPIYEFGLAVDRVRAAADVAHADGGSFVVTARAENYVRGRYDLPDTIARLQAFQEAGADVLFAPGVRDPGDLKTLLASVDRPVNVLVSPATPPVPELAAMGVARISVGGGFAAAAWNAVAEAARELQHTGTAEWATRAAGVRDVLRNAFG
jgi:2-methylisocitrate lyase-like PEP mutase family enzyme